MHFGLMAGLALALLQSAMGADPFVGTWKPDATKWKVSAGISEVRKTEFLIFEAVGKDTYRRIRTTPDGKPGSSPPQAWIVDSKVHKTLSAPGRIARINERHWRNSRSNSSGKLVEDFVVSPDGETLTITRRGVGMSTGRSIDETYVYQRQHSKP